MSLFNWKQLKKKTFLTIVAVGAIYSTDVYWLTRIDTESGPQFLNRARVLFF